MKNSSTNNYKLLRDTWIAAFFCLLLLGGIAVRAHNTGLLITTNTQETTETENKNL